MIPTARLNLELARHTFLGAVAASDHEACQQLTQDGCLVEVRPHYYKLTAAGLAARRAASPQFEFEDVFRTALVREPGADGRSESCSRARGRDLSRAAV